MTGDGVGAVVQFMPTGFVGGCVVHDENNDKRLSSSGSPEVWLMIFSKDQIKIEDTWQVSGLKGTGSNHFSVKNAFVPKGKASLAPGPRRETLQLYSFLRLDFWLWGCVR